ncbi:MAG TPA: hypothetical protein PLO96_03735, partial [Candidatus Cloacimonas acidaminovorans]|nr:hypothetical protein [Candidatus Cloacimonas acidaminovorans]
VCLSRRRPRVRVSSLPPFSKGMANSALPYTIENDFTIAFQYPGGNNIFPFLSFALSFFKEEKLCGKH